MTKPKLETIITLRLPILAGFLMLLLHGTLLVNQSFYRTYDALIHIFFASHYAQSWFDPWEPRWYTGFTVFSYPPLAHQLIAALSWLVGLQFAFVVVQILALLLLTLGVYRFSSLLVSSKAAGYATLLLVISSSVIETVHVFGQLPTILSLGFLLNALPFAMQYLRSGQRFDLYKALSLLAITTTAHHVTTLFGTVFFLLPLVATVAWQARITTRPLEPDAWWRVMYRITPSIYRSGLLLGVASVLLVLMVLPYWLWVQNDPLVQTPIPHASRDNFLQNPNAGMMFFVLPWFSTLMFLPYAIFQTRTTWRWAFGLSLCLLLLLGTGSTTPLPKLLLRGAFDVLTLERFTFWATIMILPFAGMALETMLHGHFAVWLKLRISLRLRLVLFGSSLLILIGMAIFISNMSRLRQFQPEPITMKPVVQFLEKDEHWRYRYLTLGFGDQMAWLSANTKALTPDGNYHSARRLIELTSTPVERLDGAKYKGVPGLGSLEDFLSNPQRFFLKFIFSNDTFYDPLLFFHGWHQVVRLENNVVVWEREDISPLPERLPRPAIALWQRLAWGCLPFFALLIAAWVLLQPADITAKVLFWHRYDLGQKILRLLQPDVVYAFSLETPQVLQLTPWKWLFRAVAFCVFISAGAIFYGFHSARVTPEKTVQQYWNDLDFGRFAESYRFVLPQNGLTLERYLLDRSVQGGLLTNYAKLEGITTKILGLTASQATVQANLTWLTSLGSFSQTTVHQLVLSNQGWRIQGSPSNNPRPPVRFQTEAVQNYYRAPRRLTTAISDARDILDRPQLRVLQQRLVRWYHQGQIVYSVIGELENVDARPADCTVTAILRDAKNQVLAESNVGSLMLHKLLPGERTAFRVDFFGRDTVKTPERLASFEVLAKAVVTQFDLQRPLATWAKPQAKVLDVKISNISAQSTMIPRVFLSLYDNKGLAWLEVQPIKQQIVPRQTIESQVLLVLPKGYVNLPIKNVSSDADVVFDALGKARLQPLTAPLELSQLKAFRIQMQAFMGSP